MNLEEEKFEDREGSNFEERRGANLQKIMSQKEKTQKKKLGIKPTDTSIDVSNAVTRDVLGKVLSEEMPKQEVVGQEAQTDDEEDETEEKENKTFNHEEEKRIKLMQLLNPRIVKSHELKNYMSREDIKEEVYATLNQLASHKLDLYKKLIGLEEGKQENKEKLRNFTRQVGTKGAIKGFVPFDMNHSPLRSGRAILRNEPTEKQQRFNLVPRPTLTPEQEAEKETLRLQTRLERGQINPDEAIAASAEGLRQQHYSLHEGIVPKKTEKKSDDRSKNYSTGDFSVQKMMSNAAQRIGNLTLGQIGNAVGKAAINTTPVGAVLVGQNIAKNISSKLKNKPVKKVPIPMPHTPAPGEPRPMPEPPKRNRGFPQQQFAEETEQLEEGAPKRNPNIMRQGRTKVVKARVRGGKVQRRKRLSAVKGYTIRGGKLKRMSMQERLRRKRAQRRAKVKRRAKMARALMRRKRSMRRRASLGLKE